MIAYIARQPRKKPGPKPKLRPTDAFETKNNANKNAHSGDTDDEVDDYEDLGDA